MLNLLYKDLKLQKIGVKSLLVCLIILFVGVNSGNMGNYLYRIVVPIIVYSYVIIGISYDNYFKVEGAIASLPVSKNEIVLSKYLNILIAVGFGVIITILITFGMAIKFNVGIMEFLDLKRLFLSLWVSGFIIVILIPLYLKYGLIKGKVITVLGMAVLGMAIFIGTNIMLGFFDEIKSNIFNSNYSIIIVIGLFLLSLILSYNISRKLYERREF